MQTEFGYTYENCRYRCIATRRDLSWGHGLKVEIFDGDGKLFKVVLFACHPEFPDNEIIQAMNTEQLVDLASRQLQSDKVMSPLLDARYAQLQLIFRLEINPDAPAGS